MLQVIVFVSGCSDSQPDLVKLLVYDFDWQIERGRKSGITQSRTFSPLSQ
jgi:hypothetical protein